MLEEARENIPQIRRYAKGSPHTFLREVEQRSSLLVEAGHRVENGHPVPFYQFRHLTFQEYLAAFAAVEGHYLAYKKGDTILTPLAPYIATEEWKEVIPMAAVLAKKQAEPLMAVLVKEASKFRAKVESAGELPGKVKWRRLGPVLPPCVAGLLQCLVEEAEAAPETLTVALQLAAFFAFEGEPEEDWTALVRGPYGAELLHQVWLLYAPMKWSRPLDPLRTYALLARYRQTREYWASAAGQSELERSIRSADQEQAVGGLLTCLVLFGNATEEYEDQISVIVSSLMTEIERHLFSDCPALQLAAVYASAFHLHYQWQAARPSVAVLDRLLNLRLHGTHWDIVLWSDMALSSRLNLTRSAWKPALTETEMDQLRREVRARGNLTERLAALVIAFHSGTVCSEDELAKLFARARRQVESGGDGRSQDAINGMLGQMGEVGRKWLKPREARPQGAK